MANQPVIIKSNKYGLIVILDAELSMEKLKEEVAEKFRSSAKFFGEAQMAVCFQGRGLSLEEEMELVETISGNCQIRIVSIIDENEEQRLLIRYRRKAHRTRFNRKKSKKVHLILLSIANIE